MDNGEIGVERPAGRTAAGRRQKVRNTLLLVSFLLLPVTMFYFSPYLIISGGLQGIVAGSFLVFGAMFLASLFMGRFWCGWLCPTGGLQEYACRIRDRRARGGRYNWIKFFIWVPWLAGIVFAFIKGGGFKSIDPFYQIDKGVTVATPQNIIPVLVLAATMVLMVLAFGRRAFCHYLCWMSPFMILGRRLAVAARLPCLRLEADAEKCVDCRKCTQVCTMSLDVNAMVRKGPLEDPECNLCGKCADSCPRQVIDYRFGKPAWLRYAIITLQYH